MAILVTGGTGKTSGHLIPSLTEANIPFVVTSRRGADGFPVYMRDKAAKFDWCDSATYDTPFEAAKEPIKAVYIVAPEVEDPNPPMIAFIDHARDKYGVQRFVLLSAATVEPDNGIEASKTWKHMLDLKLEVCALKPTWFSGNFVYDFMGFRDTIKKEGKIYSAAADGRTYFVTAKDIAAVAFAALTSDEPPAGEYWPLGPDALSYDDVAAIIGKVVGKDVQHVRLTEAERKEQLMRDQMLPEGYADMLSMYEAWTASKAGEAFGVHKDDVERLSGRPSQSFEDWARENKEAWL